MGINDENWNLVENLCKKNPKLAGMSFDRDPTKKTLPIHRAATLSPTKRALNSIIQAYPKGLQSKESTFDELPLHLACSSYKSEKLIRSLLSKYPDGAAQVDKL